MTKLVELGDGRYTHICTKCGKDCQLIEARNPKANPVSRCCRVPADSFTQR